MLTIECKDVVSVKNDLLVYVADKVAAIPTLKNHQFMLFFFDVDEIIIEAYDKFNEILGSFHNYFGIKTHMKRGDSWEDKFQLFDLKLVNCEGHVLENQLLLV